MANECKITDPGAFYHCDEEGKEWLGIDIRDCQLGIHDTVWIKSQRPRRGGDYIRQPPSNLTRGNSLRLPITWTQQRLLSPPPDDPEMLSSDPHTVWFGLDVRGIGQDTQKDLGAIRFLLIPCDALEAKRVPGFEGGCIP